MADGPRTWILTGSPENCAATAAPGFTAIGRKQRRRNQAPRMGQARTICAADAAVLMDRMAAAAGVCA